LDEIKTTVIIMRQTSLYVNKQFEEFLNVDLQIIQLWNVTNDLTGEMNDGQGNFIELLQQTLHGWQPWAIASTLVWLRSWEIRTQAPSGWRTDFPHTRGDEPTVQVERASARRERSGARGKPLTTKYQGTEAEQETPWVVPPRAARSRRMGVAAGPQAVSSIVAATSKERTRNERKGKC